MAVFISVVVLFTLGYIVYDYILAQSELNTFKENPEVLAIKEKEDLIKRLREIVSIPENEEPTVATVQDAQALRQQTFFSRAENGDKVILFPMAQRAILYRPSIQKIIEAAPINITDIQQGVTNNLETTQQSTPSISKTIEEQSKTYTLAIYNGTLTVEGLAGKAADFVRDSFSEEDISIETLNNSKNFYEETIIVDFTNTASIVLDKLINQFDASLQELPQVETDPKTDFLIILGTDIVSKL